MAKQQKAKTSAPKRPTAVPAAVAEPKLTTLTETGVIAPAEGETSPQATLTPNDLTEASALPRLPTRAVDQADGGMPLARRMQTLHGRSSGMPRYVTPPPPDLRSKPPGKKAKKK